LSVITTVVRATGLASLRPVIVCFLVTGMMVEVLKQAGTAQYLSVEGETASGPAALRGFCLLNSLLTSLSRMERVVTVEGEEGGGSEVGSCEKALALAVVGAGTLVDGVTGDGVRTVPLSFKSDRKTTATFTRSLDCLNLETFLDPVPFFIAFTRSRVKKKSVFTRKRWSGVVESALKTSWSMRIK